MKKEIFPKVLKAASFTVVLMFFYPFVMVTGSSFERSVTDNILRLAIIAACGTTGYFIRIFLYGTELRHGFFIKCLYAAMSLVPSAAVVFLYNGVTVDKALFMLMLTAAFLAGIYFSGTDYRAIVSSTTISTLIVVYFLSMVAAIIMHLTLPMTQCVIVFMADFMLYTMISNQSNIDYMMERRRHGMENLPPKIRSYNLKIIGIICTVIALCSIFNKYVEAALRVLLRILLKPVEWFIMFLNWFSRLLMIEQEFDPTNRPEKEVLPEEEEMSHGNDYTMLIFTVLFIAAAIFLLIKYRKQIKASVIRAFKLIKELIARLFGGSVKRNKIDSGIYYDIEEKLKREKKEADTDVKEVSRRSVVKEWRKGCEAYRKMPTGEEKFRFGYRLCHEGNILAGKELHEWLTPIENAKIVKSAVYSKSADVYCELKYGGGSTELTQALEAQDAYLEQLNLSVKKG